MRISHVPGAYEKSAALQGHGAVSTSRTWSDGCPHGTGHPGAAWGKSGAVDMVRAKENRAVAAPVPWTRWSRGRPGIGSGARHGTRLCPLARRASTGGTVFHAGASGRAPARRSCISPRPRGIGPGGWGPAGWTSGPDLPMRDQPSRSSGRVPSGVPSAASWIFSTRSSARFSRASHWRFSAAPRS